MEITNKVRRHYAPLDISVSAACTSGGSPLMQTTDGVNYYPDRTLVHCVVSPIINAVAADGSWNNKTSNLYLLNVTWKVNTGLSWRNISDVSEWTGKYEVDESDTVSRGSITIKRNVGANDKQQLMMEADLYDYRTRQLHHIITDALTLYTINKGADTYSIGIGAESNISYNPAIDRLSLYEYKVANGLITPSDDARQACMDGNEYLKTIPIDVYLAKQKVTTGYSLTLSRIVDERSTTLAPSTPSNPNELVSFSLTSLALDLRLIEKADYVLSLIVGNKAVAKYQFNVSRIYPRYDIEFRNVSGVRYNQDLRSNMALVHHANSLVEYPHRLLDMSWTTIAHNANNSDVTKRWQDGDRCQYSIADTGLDDSDTSELEDKLSFSARSALTYALDESGYYLFDDQGEALLLG